MFRIFGALKLPISSEEQAWVDDSFLLLARVLGRERMTGACVILPEDRFFPEAYQGTKSCVVRMADRVAEYMSVPREGYRVELYAEGEDAWKDDLPLWSGRSQDAAGLYFHTPEDKRFLIGIHAKQIRDPLALVATLAHEFAHVILLGGQLLGQDTPNLESLTDLCTVYLGLGFFTASVAYRFRQWTTDQKQGWSTERKGYLSEELWGYALAKFASERRERSPEWAIGLPTNVRGYFKQSQRWIAA